MAGIRFVPLEAGFSLISDMLILLQQGSYFPHLLIYFCGGICKEKGNSAEFPVKVISYPKISKNGW
jgi:hypothetical protein